MSRRPFDLPHAAATALLVVLAACSIAASCEKKPAENPDRWKDDEDTAESLTQGTPCHRAAARVHALRCSFDKPNFEAFCDTETDAGVPLCPLRIARAKTCQEIEDICR